MPTVSITLDLACCRCRSKIEKILCCIQERCGFVFEKVVYEKDKVLISGPFDAVDLCCKLRCKAGCFASKIEIVPPPPPKLTKEEEEKKKKEEEDKKKKKETKPVPDPCKQIIPSASTKGMYSSAAAAATMSATTMPAATTMSTTRTMLATPMSATATMSAIMSAATTTVSSMSATTTVSSMSATTTVSSMSAAATAVSSMPAALDTVPQPRLPVLRRTRRLRVLTD
ncbi:hypothetical protein U9M48_032373 [Paspalum notatum var. saurae]|uniref:HMA domain-containing protein n=1 Tax=Paspalum notatum var. saurae TaxID=547442 RepID=A0AAQ3U5U1_PASNO